jgi:sulfur-oxidizing protein SoxX
MKHSSLRRPCALAILSCFTYVTNADGQAIAFDRMKGNCLACHVIAGGDSPGNIGPELSNMQARYPDKALLRKRIWDETEFNPVTVMPPFGKHRILSEQEIDQVVEFLYTL